MTQPAITTLTSNATADNLTQEDYRDIYNELRQQDPEQPNRYAISLDAFVHAIGSSFSKAAWSKYHRGKMALNRAMRNELRLAVGLPLLPPIVGDAIAHLDPDATVIQVGDHPVPHLAILIAHPEPVTLYVNGSVEAILAGAKRAHVTKVTRAPRRSISLPVAQFDKLNAMRKQAGLTWAEFLLPHGANVIEADEE